MEPEKKEESKEEKSGCPKGKVSVFGYALVIIGLLFLIEKLFDLNVFMVLPWDYIWPALIILLGFHIIYKKNK